MKKILMLLFAGLWLASVEAVASQNDLVIGPPITDVDIPITAGGGNNGGDGEGGSGGNYGTSYPQPTSVGEAVEARYLGSESLLELWFNTSIGRVEVELTDLSTGRPLLTYVCDTNYETELYLPLTLYEGSYKLSIVGADYWGFGLFEL